MELYTALDLLFSTIDGLLFGSSYVLLGIGFTLIFGVMHKINMSFAAASVGATYLALMIISSSGLPAEIAFLVGPIAGAALGALIYFCCFHFILSTTPLATLMSTVGALLLIEEALNHATEGMPVPHPVMWEDWAIEFGEFFIRGDLLFVLAVSFACMAVLLYILYRTRLGIGTRAVSQQAVAAQLCGIDLWRVNLLTFVLTGTLGGIAGTMVGAAIGVLSPLLTLPLSVKGLIVAVIGGLGSIPGSIIAGLLVGGVEGLALGARGVAERDLYVMLLLFVFLVFRPGGIFPYKGQLD
jgi:branched-chain amino acid transport system permease protein